MDIARNWPPEIEARFIEKLARVQSMAGALDRPHLLDLHRDDYKTYKAAALEIEVADAKRNSGG